MRVNTTLQDLGNEGKASQTPVGDSMVSAQGLTAASDAAVLAVEVKMASDSFDNQAEFMAITREELDADNSADDATFDAVASVENVKKLSYALGYADTASLPLTHESITKDPAGTRILAIEKKENIFVRIWNAIKAFFKKLLDFGKKLIGKIAGAFVNITAAAQKVLDKQKELGSIKAGAEFASDEIDDLKNRLGGSIFMANDADLSSKAHVEVVEFYTKDIGELGNVVYDSMKTQFTDKITKAVTQVATLKLNGATGKPTEAYAKELVDALGKDFATSTEVLKTIGDTIGALEAKAFVNSDKKSLLAVLDTDIKVPEDIKSVSGSVGVTYSKAGIMVVPYSVKGKSVVKALVYTIPSKVAISKREAEGTEEEKSVANLDLVLRHVKPTTTDLVIKNKLEIKKSAIMTSSAIVALATAVLKAGDNVKTFERDLLKKAEAIEKAIDASEAIKDLDADANKIGKIMTGSVEMLKPLTKSFGMDVMTGYSSVCTDYLHACAISQDYYDEA